MNGRADAAEIQRLLDEAPMSRLQMWAVAITAALSMLEGYDVLSVSFAGPGMLQSWHIGKAALGAVFSSGLVGMAIGSLLLAPLADKWGRRAAILGALVLMTIGGAWSALARSALEMAGSRVVTGLGIGLLIAVTTPLSAEFANLRRRAFAVSATAMAYPLGGVVGGLAAAVLMRNFGWPSVFAVKALVALVLLPVVLIWLPESPAYFMALSKPRAVERLQAYLARCGHGPIAISLGTGARPKRAYAELFASDQAGVTLQLIAVNGLYTMVAFYMVSWLPQMVVDAGYPSSMASLISATANLSGVVGGLTLGFAARWLKLRRLVVGAIAVAGASMALFGYAPAYLPLLALAAGCCGFFLFGGISGLYATIATSFKAHVRASGTGLVMGIGRITSATAPYLAGWMFATGLGRNSVSATFAALSIVAAVILALPLRARSGA